jgi:hypothetical protein
MLPRIRSRRFCFWSAGPPDQCACLSGNEAFFAGPTLTAIDAGDALAKPGGFWSALWSMTDRMPLYPLLLAGVQRAFGDAPRVVALIQAVIDAGTCTALPRSAPLSPRVGWVAGILAAFSVTFVVVSSQVLTDTLFLLLHAHVARQRALPAASGRSDPRRPRRRSGACHAARRRGPAGGRCRWSLSLRWYSGAVQRCRRSRPPVHGRCRGAIAPIWLRNASNMAALA